MPTYLGTVCDSFHATEAELSSYRRNHVAHKADEIYYLTFSRKILPTPGQQHRNARTQKNKPIARQGLVFTLEVFLKYQLW